MQLYACAFPLFAISMPKSRNEDLCGRRCVRDMRIAQIKLLCNCCEATAERCKSKFANSTRAKVSLNFANSITHANVADNVSVLARNSFRMYRYFHANAS